MRLEVLEDDKDRLKVEVKGETLTLPQLVASTIWDKGGEAAAIQEHPFMEDPKIIVKGPSPKKLLEKAADVIAGQCEEFKEEFQKASKK